MVGEPPRACPSPPRNPNSHLPHGWTLDDLAAFSRHVARTARGLIIDPAEAADVAAVAMIGRLYTDPAPEKVDVLRAASSAVAMANTAEWKFRGMDKSWARRGRWSPPPGFAKYHYGASLTAPFEEEVLDRLALGQLWSALPAEHREILAALAEHGTTEGARDSLGLTLGAWYRRIRAARRTARRLWFWPDPPAAQYGTDRPGAATPGRNRWVRRARSSARRPA